MAEQATAEQAGAGAGASDSVATTEAAPSFTSAAPDSPRSDIVAAIEKLTPSEDGKGARDAQGRFSKTTGDGSGAPKAGQQDKTAKAAVPDKSARPNSPGETPAARAPGAAKVPAPSQEETGLKAPGSWRPGAKSKWAETPKEVQEEVKRLERLQADEWGRATPAMRFQSEFDKLVGPYESHLRADAAARGAQYNPLDAVRGYLNTVVALRTASPEQRAQMVASVAGQYGTPPDALIAHVIRSFKGDMKDLDAAVAARLQGQPRAPTGPAFDPNALAQQLEQRLEQKFAARQLTVKAQTYAEELPAFFEKHGLSEYFEGDGNTLAEDMAKALEGGFAADLDEALGVALSLSKNKDISAVVQQRREAESAEEQNSTVQKAKAAAKASVKGAPVGPRPIPVSKGDFNQSRKDDIRAAIARLKATG